MKGILIHLPFEISLSVESDCEEILKRLECKFGNYTSFYNSASTNNTVNIIVKKQYDDFLFEYSGNSTIVKNPIREIDCIINGSLQKNSDYIALHGAAVESNNQAYVFLAATTKGKTTLTSFLTSKGLGYLTDDCVLLNRRNLFIHPFATPLQIRRGGFEILEEYHLQPSTYRVYSDNTDIRYVYTPKYVSSSEIVLKDIFFIERTPNVNQLLELDMTERIYRLMQSPLVDYSFDKTYLKSIVKLASIRSRVLRYHDMNYVYEIISQKK